MSRCLNHVITLIHTVIQCQGCESHDFDCHVKTYLFTISVLLTSERSWRPLASHYLPSNSPSFNHAQPRSWLDRVALPSPRRLYFSRKFMSRVEPVGVRSSRAITLPKERISRSCQLTNYIKQQLERVEGAPWNAFTRRAGAKPWLACSPRQPKAKFCLGLETRSNGPAGG